MTSTPSATAASMAATASDPMQLPSTASPVAAVPVQQTL